MLELLVSQRVWEDSPKGLGRSPKGFGKAPQRVWEGSPKGLGGIPKGFGGLPQWLWGTMLSSIAYHRLNVATSSIQPLAYKIATIGATATGITGIVIATIGRTGRRRAAKHGYGHSLGIVGQFLTRAV